MGVECILGFRALTFLGGKWLSPSMGSPWENKIMWAECCHCPKDDDGHVIIRRECSCGIHATLWPDEITEYMTRTASAVFLVEALGHNADPARDARSIWAHTYGFTATGVEVVGVVNWTDFNRPLTTFSQTWEGEVTRNIPPSYLWMEKAARDFKVKIIPWNTARVMAQIMWERFGLKWPSEITKI